jgi:hypothetical protein
MTQKETELPNLYGERRGQLHSNHKVAAAADDDGADDNNDNHLFSAHIMSSWFSSLFNNTQKSLTKKQTGKKIH